MSKLDAKPMQHAQLSKSEHDMNHVYDFTSSTGMILPIVCDILNPGENIMSKVDLSETRTMPLDSAAYLNLDLHVDYFFVPLTLLMSKFESFIYRINDFYSSAEAFNFGLPLFDMDLVKKQITSMARGKVESGVIGYDFDDFAKGALRLFDHLGLGTMFNSTSTGYVAGEVYNPQVFPWALLAYNACYEYYYINDEYEKFDNSIFNIDYYVNAGTNIPDSIVGTSDICVLKYRNKYHDYFTRLKASPIVSGQNLLDGAGRLSQARNWLSREQFFSNFNVLTDGNSGSVGTSDATVLSGSPNSSSLSVAPRTQFGFAAPNSVNTSPSFNSVDINTANLRALFANEKLWTITGMNRKQYDAQTLAHFGFDVPTDVLHQIQHIGHHLYNIKVGEVISTAGTSSQPLATVAGKGYAFENNDAPIKFTAPCHGIFMALYSSAIHRNYFGTFRKENAIGSWQDFYQPEYDHLGMQPLFAFEGIQDTFQNGTVTFGNILGWQYRYEQFKSRYDRSTLAFANHFYAGSSLYSGPFSSWSPSNQPYKGLNVGAQQFLPLNVYKWLFKENPCELNNLLSVSYDPRWYDGASGETLDYLSQPWTAYGTDPLVHHALIKYSKLSTMSAYSMPKLND